MDRNDLCFCGSGVKYKYCHRDINSNSIIVRLYNLYNYIDKEIEKQKKERNLNFKCQKGCSECCSQCFSISESEFILIIDYIKRNWEKDKINKLIIDCQEQWRIVQETIPTFAQELQEFIGGKSINNFLLSDLYMPLKLPFPCIFLDHETQSCMIYKVRPLICRTHGVSIIDTKQDNQICSKIPSLFSIQNEIVDLHKIEYEMGSFIVLNRGKRGILRRPFPIFYYLNFVFSEVTDIDKFMETQMYNRITVYSESDYINDIIQTYS